VVEFSLREYEASDAAAVLQLNAESVAVLSPMDADRLQLLAGMASLHLVAVGPSGVIGQGAAPGSVAAPESAVDVLVTSMVRAAGKCLASQLRHCDNACGLL